VIEPLPRRTAPRSAVSGIGGRSAGKPAVIEPPVCRSKENSFHVSSLKGQDLPSLRKEKFADGTRTSCKKAVAIW
jgi:hypothetical protein